MALFADGPANSVEQLADEDSGLLDTAETCGINIRKKLQLAWEEIRSDLNLWLERRRTVPSIVWTPLPSVEQIVVNEPLRRWERMSALVDVYRDAYFSELVDRYQAKWDEYAKLSRTARETFIATGLDLVADPVRKAAPPLLGTVTGSDDGGMYYASVAWVNSRGNEGEASAPASIVVAGRQLMTVTAADAPNNAVGWNVYAGSSPASMTLQNTILLGVGDTYTYIPGAVSRGRAPGFGQRPEFRQPLVRTLLRG
jgi:hypothetical protein